MHVHTDVKQHEHTLRISAKKTPQDNPYYYSNERLSRCLRTMELLCTGSYLTSGIETAALTLRVLSVVGLEGGYRAACGDDVCRVDVEVWLSREVSAAELTEILRPLGEKNGICITVLNGRKSYVE